MIALVDHEGSTERESDWDSIHGAMVEAMVRFEEAFKPHVERYRRGERAPGAVATA